MKRVMAVLAAVAVLAILWRFPAGQWFAGGREWLQGLGVWGPMAAAAVYALLTVAMVPGSALTLAIASLMGFWKGLMTVLVGANLGALGAFLLFRTLFRNRAEALARKHPTFGAVDAAVARRGFHVVMLLRLSPVFPFTVLNALLGLTAIRAGTYVLANLLGMLPGTTMYVAIGSACADCLAAPALHWGRLALQAGGVVATIVVAVQVSRMARQALDAETGEVR